MPKINVNLNEVETQEAIPAENYVVRVIKGEKATGNESGEPYIAWELEVVEGDWKGRHLFTNTSLQKHALWKVIQLFQACKVAWNKDGTFTTEDLIGAELTAVVGQREYKGKPGNEVTDYLAA